MKVVLNSPHFSVRVTYLDGSALSDKDLTRACALRAKAVFVFSDKFTSNRKEEDASTILQAMSVKRYAERRSYGKEIMTCEFPLKSCLALIKSPRHLTLLFQSYQRPSTHFTGEQETVSIVLPEAAARPEIPQYYNLCQRDQAQPSRQVVHLSRTFDHRLQSHHLYDGQ